MQPLDAFPVSARRRIAGVFTDIDDTLSTAGRLTAEAFTALEALHDSGLIVVPITGRPAGWCDHIARMWPVDGVVGENGAFYFRYDHARRKMIRRFMQSATERAENRRRLEKLRRRILSDVPGSALAADQHYRETDLAIDYCEDVERLGVEQVRRIVTLFEDAGATAKVSSIHVNGWFGDHDKLAMTRIMMAECFDIDLDEARERFVFVGDSPNDAPMFAYFPNAVGVANIRAFEKDFPVPPAYVTERQSGQGFAELAAVLIEARK
ncbi:MAG: HAD-IIB family hydrolase [Proteobacteria bacterium]|nr:HAD-IIB family hydrolase [Pseudomonadota bacterium]